jgi:hypothetical protein
MSTIERRRSFSSGFSILAPFSLGFSKDTVQLADSPILGLFGSSDPLDHVNKAQALNYKCPRGSLHGVGAHEEETEEEEKYTQLL